MLGFIVLALSALSAVFIFYEWLCASLLLGNHTQGTYAGWCPLPLFLVARRPRAPAGARGRPRAQSYESGWPRAMKVLVGEAAETLNFSNAQFFLMVGEILPSLIRLGRIFS